MLKEEQFTFTSKIAYNGSEWNIEFCFDAIALRISSLLIYELNSI